jgi:hypothetical protein
MVDDDKLRAAVERIFEEHIFKRLPNSLWLHDGIVDGVRVGVVEATYNSNFGNYTLNCEECRRAVKANKSGVVGAAYVARTRYDAETNKKVVTKVEEATALAETLSGVEPRQGRYGPFWTLGDSDDEDW